MPWDSPLGSVAELVQACCDLPEPPERGRLTVSRVVVQIPVELAVRAGTGAGTEVLIAPPRQAVETTVMPALHRLRLVIEGSS